MDRYDLVLQDAKLSAQKDPKNQHAAFLTGLCEDRFHHLQQALKWFEKAQTMQGLDLAGIHRNKAFVLLELNKPDEARGEILQAMKMDKTGLEVDRNTDVVILESIDHAIIRRPLLDPKAKDADLMAKADALYNAKKDVECLRVIEQILSHDANNIAAHELKGDTCNRNMEDANAVAEMKKVISAHPDYQHAYAVMAENLVRLKQCPEALAAAERALKIGGPD